MLEEAPLASLCLASFVPDHRLYGYSVRELYHTAVGVPGHRDYNVLDPLWELAIDSISQTVPLLRYLQLPLPALASYTGEGLTAA